VPVWPPGLSVTFATVTRRSAWGPPVTKDFHAREDEAIASPHGRRARALSRIGEGEGGRELAPEDGQEKALALRACRQSQEPAIAPENAVVEDTLRSARSPRRA